MDAHNDKQLLVFSFTCRNQDINWAKNLLADLGIRKVIIKGDDPRMTFDDGESDEVKVQGMCSLEELKGLTSILSKNKIAGYSADVDMFRKSRLPARGKRKN